MARRSLDPVLVGSGMIAILALALFFRLYHLDTFLHWAFGDEMSYGLEGQNVIHGRYSSLLTYTWDAAPATYAYLLAMAQQIFGVSLHTGRMVSVVFGTLTVPLLVACAREMEISWTGSLLAGGLLAVSHWDAHFSRMVLPAAPSAFALLLAIYCVMVAYRRERLWTFGVAGMACGSSLYLFHYNRVLPPIFLLWFVYLAAFQRPWLLRNWRGVIAFVSIFLAVLAPLVRFWLHDIDWFMQPEHHVGIFYNLSYWAGQHPGQSTAMWNVLWHQIPLALGMFVVNGGPFPPWGGTYAPALDPVTGWLFFIAFAFGLSCWRRPLVALLLIWASLIWFLGVVMTIDAPQMEHAVGMIPAIFLLIAVLCDTLGCRLVTKTGRPLIYAGLAALLVVISGALNFQAYFGTWEPQLAGANGFTWQFYDAALYMGKHQTPHGTAIYSWGYPDEFFRFLAPHAGEFPGNPRAFRRASLYIVIAGATTTPHAVAQHIQGARLERVHDIDGDLAFTVVLPPHP